MRPWQRCHSRIAAVIRSLHLLLRSQKNDLLIGLAFLATCLRYAELLVASTAPLDAILSEGLLILGWVAMWKPSRSFSTTGGRSSTQRRLFERVAHMVIETKAAWRAPVARDDVPRSRLADA